MASSDRRKSSTNVRRPIRRSQASKVRRAGDVEQPTFRLRTLRRRTRVAPLAAAGPHFRGRHRPQDRVQGFGFEPVRLHHRVDDIDQKSKRQGTYFIKLFYRRH
jgi:hypothetical protein